MVLPRYVASRRSRHSPADATRCLGVTGSLEAAALAHSYAVPFSAHTAPTIHAHAGCVDFEVLDSGCCGLAGGFGFEAGEHYDVSMKAGERLLLPMVRAAANDTLVVADGFSCREQIAHASNRRALHLADVLQIAMHESAVR